MINSNFIRFVTIDLIGVFHFNKNKFFSEEIFFENLYLGVDDLFDDNDDFFY